MLMKNLRFISCALFLAASLPVEAQTTYTWVQGTGGTHSWNTGANWSGGSAPNPTALDTIDFSTLDIGGDITLNLDATRTAANWVFGDTAGGDEYIFNNGGETFSGLITVMSGKLRFPTSASWGGAGKNISFEGSGTLTCGFDGYSGGQFSVSTGAIAFVTADRNMGFTSLVGSGQVSYGNGSKNKVLTLGDASGFTGTLLAYCTYNGGMTLQFTSIADGPGAGAIQFGGEGSSDNNQNGKFRLYGDVGPVVFNHRKVEIREPTNRNAFRFNYLQNDNSTPANNWVINGFRKQKAIGAPTAPSP